MTPDDPSSAPADGVGEQLLDFSADISPLGLPVQVREAIVATLPDADRYPDPSCSRLREAISTSEEATAEGISADMVVCGNGAADLIYRLGPALHPRQALVCSPTFDEYERALELWGCQVSHHPLRSADGFAVTASILDAITDATDLVFLCQPNNPTGIVCDRQLVLDILRRCEDHDARLVVDECFVDFLDDPRSASVQDEVTAHPGLIVLKSFTKLFAMPGIRLGYAVCADTTTVEALELAGQPWAVSSLAQAAGIAACREGADYVQELRQLIRAERAFLKDGLRKLGMSSTGEANFLFFRSPDLARDASPRTSRLPEELRRRGIVVRDCAGFEGLDDGYCRVAIRTHADNQRLLDALAQVLPPAPSSTTVPGDKPLPDTPGKDD